MPRTPGQLKATRRAGGLAVHAKYGTDAIVARARAGFMDKFLREVDSDHRLPEDERQRRAHMALRAHMNKLAAKAVEARRRKRATMTPLQYDAHRAANPGERLDG